jgi:nicotinamide mononucleotide transporter
MSGVIEWLNTPVFYAFGAPTSWAEVLGFITGALCVWLVAKQNIWNWPIGILNNILWIVLFITAGLYADSALQIVYIILALIGWYTWIYGGTNRSALVPTYTSIKEWAWLFITGLAGFSVIVLVLSNLTNSTVPGWDALTTILSLLAVWGQIKKKVESWYLWMIADIVYIPLYVYKGLTLTAILYAGFFSLCVVGLIKWKAAAREATCVRLA